MADDFAAIPQKPLPFRSVLIIARPIPCYAGRGQGARRSLGFEFVDAGDSNHINTRSGHGPGPDGLLRFAGFMKSPDGGVSGGGLTLEPQATRPIKLRHSEAGWE